jgi:hypothetical protein
LFYQAQDALDGRKRLYKPKIASIASLPLRGSLICPKCGKFLTGSASKGRTKYYSYYHCFDGCTCRFPADVANNAFVGQLKQFVPRAELREIYKIALLEAWYDQANHSQDDKAKLIKEMKEIEGKIAYIRELLSTQQIEPVDFRDMKTEYSAQLEKLESRIQVTTNLEESIAPLLTKGIDNLLKMDFVYQTADTEIKRENIGSMYPEKMTFDGTLLRTTRVNEAMHLIYSLDKGFSEKKIGQEHDFRDLSKKVNRIGISSNHLKEDLSQLHKIKSLIFNSLCGS